MSSQPIETREPLDESITEEQIQQLIAERAAEGMECRVEAEGGQRVLVCVLPAL